MSSDAQQPARSAMSVVVTRANGDVEDLGVVAYTSRNPIQQAYFAARKALGLRVDPNDVLRAPDHVEES